MTFLKTMSMFISDIQTTVMVLMNNSNEIKLSKLPVSRKVKAYTTGKIF
jgi:hypothetical protein